MEAGQGTEHKLLKLNIVFLSCSPLPKIGRGQCTEELWVSITLEAWHRSSAFHNRFKKNGEDISFALFGPKRAQRENTKALGPSASYEKEAAEIHQ